MIITVTDARRMTSLELSCFYKEFLDNKYEEHMEYSQ